LTIGSICISSNIPKDVGTLINVANKNPLFEEYCRSPDIQKTAQVELQSLKPLISKDSKSIL
jgi:hypothetical protein